jgi:hypothetical protein
MPGRAKKLPAAAERLLAKCSLEGLTAKATARLIFEELGLEIPERTVSRRLREFHPDEKVRRILGIFLDLCIEKIRTLNTRRKPNDQVTR